MNRHVGRGLIVMAILLVAFWIKPANTQEQECFWEEAIDKTIVCDALIITHLIPSNDVIPNTQFTLMNTYF